MKQEKDKLTVEESEELIRLGIPWHYSTIFRTEVPARVSGFHDTHIFTFQNLLSLLPLMIYREGKFLTLTIIPWVGDLDSPKEDENEEILDYMRTGKGGYWMATYSDNGYLKYYIPEFASKELIDSVFGLVKWCLQEGYIKPDKL